MMLQSKLLSAVVQELADEQLGDLFDRLILAGRLIEDIEAGFSDCIQHQPALSLPTIFRFCDIVHSIAMGFIESLPNFYHSDALWKIVQGLEAISDSILAPGNDKAGSFLVIANILLAAANVSPTQQLLLYALSLFQKARTSGCVPKSHDWAVSLVSESKALQMLASIEVDSLANLSKAMDLISRARSEGLERGKRNWAVALLEEGNTRMSLADLRINSHSNLEQAIQLYGRSRREGFERNRRDWAAAIISEANARYALADLSIDARNNLERAIKLCIQSRDEGFQPNTQDWANSLITEAKVLCSLADLGVNSRSNLGQAIQLYQQSRNEGTQQSTRVWVTSLVNEGYARASLGKLGVDSQSNLEQAIRLFERSRSEGLQQNTEDWAQSLLNESSALTLLGDLGIGLQSNLEQAIRLCERSRSEGFQQNTEDWAQSLLNESSPRQRLAHSGIDSQSNLEQAILLCERSRSEGFQQNTQDWAQSLISEANTRRTLADQSIDSQSNLEQAILLCERSRSEGFQQNTQDWATSLMNEGYARRAFAIHNIDSKCNMEEASLLFQRSRSEGFHQHTRSWALTLMNEGFALQYLGQLGVDTQRNLEKAILLHEQSRREGFLENTPDWARALMNEGLARKCMAEAGIKPDLNRELARDCYQRGLLGVGNDRLLEMRLLWGLSTIAISKEERKNLLGRAVGIVRHLSTTISRDSHRSRNDEYVFSLFTAYIDACLGIGDLKETAHTIHEVKGRSLSAALRRNMLFSHKLSPEVSDIVQELNAIDTTINSASDAFVSVDESVPTSSATSEARYRLIGDLLRCAPELSAAFDTKTPTIEKVLEQAQQLANNSGVLIELLEVSQSQIAWIRHDLSGHADMTGGMLTADGTDFHSLVLGFLNPLQYAEQAYTFQSKLLLAEDDAVCREELMAMPDDSSNPNIGIVKDGLLGRNTLVQANLRLENEKLRLFTDLRSALSALGNALLPTLLTGIPEGMPIILSPHWHFNLIPLHALPLLEGSQILIERNPVAYLPSPTTCEAIRRSVSEDAGTSLLLCDPDGTLPAARSEPSLLRPHLLPCKALIGNDATADSLCGLMNEIGVLHLSCHGRFDHQDPQNSGLVFSDGKCSNGHEVFTYLDIVRRLRLPQTNVVFLSACESGLHEMKRTDELVGLARAFLQAGAPTIVASLWLAMDRDAASFAEYFYRAWNVPGTPLISAFRTAVLETRRGNEDNPYVWANFVMMGAWNTVRPQVESKPMAAGL